MPAGELLRGIIAIMAGYLLGSFPSAYLITRLKTGQDIRRLGDWNVGGMNTFRQAGVLPGLAVIAIDIGKGSAAVALAYWGLALPQSWVLVAALAAVTGHNWMVWLGFTGGKGAGTSIGTVAVLLPVYGYWPGLVILGGVVILSLAIIRKIAPALTAGLIVLPFIAWLGMGSGWMVIWSLALALVIGLKYIPNLRAWVKQRYSQR